MLIECPKCGFSQPKDQYCASCGVDMQNFRSKPKPLQSRLLANPVVHISVMFMLVFMGTMYIVRQQQKQEISRRVEYLKGGPLYSETRDDAKPAKAKPVANAESPAPQAAPPPPASANSAALPASATTPPAATSQIAAATTAKSETTERRAIPAKTLKIKAYYTLVPSNLLNQIQMEQPIVQFGPVFRMGQIRNASQIIAKADVLDSAEVKFEGESNEVTWIAGDRVADGFLGLQNHLVVHNQDDGTYRGEIEILRALPEDASQTVTPVSFSGEFATTSGSAVMVSMVLPRFQPPPRSIASASKFFRFYRTTDFVSKNSEFVMFLVFE